MARSGSTTGGDLADRFGICQWFHFEDEPSLLLTVDLLHEVGVRHLRTGISWADYYREGGRAWYDRQMAVLREAGVEVLLSVWHTPPSIAEGGERCNAPPQRLRDYADFIDLVIDRYGGSFAAVELWNEPNNKYKWDFERFDPDWSKFGRMILDAAHWAQRRGITTCLGGMIPVDHHWLELIGRQGVLEHIDIVAIHAFPEMWWGDAPCWDWCDRWDGWEAKIEGIRAHARGKPIWVTETGLATCDLACRQPARHDEQVRKLEEVTRAPAERVYWYSLIDLDPAREAIEGFHVDENEYHMGLVTFEGTRKPGFERLRELLAGSRKTDRTSAEVAHRP